MKIDFINSLLVYYKILFYCIASYRLSRFYISVFRNTYIYKNIYKHIPTIKEKCHKYESK